MTFVTVNIDQYPELYAIRTNTGKHFFRDKHSYQILSGLDDSSTKKALQRYYQKHYEGKEFPSILANPQDSEHVCTFINPKSGKTLKAFSLTGLEFLCNRITGNAAEESKPKFLKLIQIFRSSIASPKAQGMDPVESAHGVISDEPVVHATAADASHLTPRLVELDESLAFTPHSQAEDKELEATQVALLNKCITPTVRQNMDQLYLRWEADEVRLHEEAKAAGRAPFGACYAGLCPLFGNLIKQGSTLRPPMVRICELSASGVPEPFQLVAVVHCYWPREVR